MLLTCSKPCAGSLFWEVPAEQPGGPRCYAGEQPLPLPAPAVCYECPHLVSGIIWSVWKIIRQQHRQVPGVLLLPKTVTVQSPRQTLPQIT